MRRSPRCRGCCRPRSRRWKPRWCETQAAGAPFVLLLNPDALLLPGALDALVATARAQPRAGIVGPLVLDVDGSVQAGSFGRFPTLAGVVSQRLRGAVRN